MKTINDVVKNNMCNGCGLCVSSPTEMSYNSKGFLRPDSPIEDVISSYCSGMKVEQKNNHENYHQVWGHVKELYTGFSNSKVIRQNGSSGGVLTGLLTYMLENNVVDGVIQIGASNKFPLQNEVKIVKSSEELIQNAGSRYAPSAPLSVIRSLIGDGNRYAIVAKPCDISSMRSLVESDHKYDAQFPVLLSFMCAGVPSQEATDDVVHDLDMTPADITSFRYRGDGWPGLTTAVDKQGHTGTMSYNDSWGTILNRKLQTRCKLCVEGIGEFADIVCADAWHESENGYPSFVEAEGRSLIMVRTRKGSDTLESAIKHDYVKLEGEFALNDLDNIQPYQSTRKKSLLARLYAVRLFGLKTTDYVGFPLKKLAKQESIGSQLKTFLGTARRMFKRTM